MAQHSKTVLALLLVGSLSVVSPALAAKSKMKVKASPPISANTLIIKRNYEAAFALNLNEARRGDSDAQLSVAQLFRIGLGTKRDDAAALEWLTKSSISGNKNATLLLRRINETGVPLTLKKPSDGATSNNALALINPDASKLPQRSANQPDWLTLAVARRNSEVIDQLAPTPIAQSGLALRTAVYNNDVPIAQKLLATAAPPEPDSRGQTALMQATAMGNAKMVNALLKGKFTINAKNNRGATAVDLAARNCQPALLSEFFVSGATVESKGDARSALIEVVKNCANWPEFKASFKGADFNVTDRLERSAAWYAAARGDALLLAWLAESGANLAGADKDGFTPLHAAAAAKQGFTVHYISSKLDSPELKSSRGTTPLMLAAWSGCEECIAPLLEKSSDVNFKNIDGDTALMFAVRAGRGSLATRLIEKGANADARNLSGDTANKLAENLGLIILKGSSQ